MKKNKISKIKSTNVVSVYRTEGKFDDLGDYEHNETEDLTPVCRNKTKVKVKLKMKK